MIFSLFKSETVEERERREIEELYRRVKASYEEAEIGSIKDFGLSLAWTFEERVEKRANVPRIGVYIQELLATVAYDTFQKSELSSIPEVDFAKPLGMQEGIELKKHLQILEKFLIDPETNISWWMLPLEKSFVEIVEALPAHIREQDSEETGGFSVAMIDVLDDPGTTVWNALLPFLADGVRERELHKRIRVNFNHNAMQASGADAKRPDVPLLRPNEWLKKQKGASAWDMLAAYGSGTPIRTLLNEKVAFSVPEQSRFEHTHIIGGSGHGKTQLLQQFLLGDLERVREGNASLVVIDSQGDMISTIMHLEEFSPDHPDSLCDRLVLIDPNDIDHPPCLNLFDVGLDRLEGYSRAEREKLMNGAIALYEYIFGALLGASLTQRQTVIFRYLARLLMVVPGATIHTLREFMENPESVIPFTVSLDGSARTFFETQFQDKAFDDTRQQILTRLWGILSNPILERMFTNRRNRLNLFEALNTGHVVLINTAKDLLKDDGCAILGRFFIALLAQAAQERAAIPVNRRLATYAYIDEAQDYFDQGVENLLNQARKYRVGLTLAHQNLDQFADSLKASVMASTAIKLAGGTSAKDTNAIAREMRCEPEFVQSMRKREAHTEFACYLKNVLPQPIRLSVPFGQMERRPRLSSDAFNALIAHNRERYCAGGEERPEPSEQNSAAKRMTGFSLGDHEML